MRQIGGEIALRVDDLDSPRVKAWAVTQAIEDLEWLGIDWDVGPVRQTDRLGVYQEALERLIDLGRAYPCTCSRKDIAEALSAPHESRFRGEGPVYPGTCASWQPGDSIPDDDFCWRFRASDRKFTFTDTVLGVRTCNLARELGDFPLTQKNGRPSYQLAVVIDDIKDLVDTVIRGNDLVPSTFRQLDLYEQLDRPAPRYAHVPLVAGSDGRRLAKRHGDTRLSHYRECGIAAERIVGWAAHSLGLVEDAQPRKAAEVIDRFDWSRLPTEDLTIDPDAIFDSP